MNRLPFDIHIIILLKHLH